MISTLVAWCCLSTFTVNVGKLYHTLKNAIEQVILRGGVLLGFV